MRLPDDTQRVAILGKTGSGKTQAGAWHLSERSYDRKPWVIVDMKGDPLLNEIEGIQRIDPGDMPRKAGLYITSPIPDDKEAIQNILWKAWSQENTGLYFDEAYMVDGPAYRAVLTQGRSKHIPVISLCQRPSWISPFLFSESEYFQVFYLNNRKDRAKVEEFTGSNSIDQRLPDYHSYYYDVGADSMLVLKPVPERNKILAVFHERIGPRRAVFI